MALDPLEKEHLRRKMAAKMGIFLEGGVAVSCVSGHVYSEAPHYCELCQSAHADEILVIKNRSGKKMHVAVPCLLEMVRFKVTDVEELPRWLEKVKELRAEEARRRADQEEARREERKKLEKKVIVRRRSTESA